MKFILAFSVIFTVASTVHATPNAEQPAYKILYSCHATNGGGLLEAMQRSTDFEIAQYRDGRVFAYSPANYFTQESTPGNVQYNVAHLRAESVARDPDRLLNMFQVQLTPIPEARLKTYENLGAHFERDYSEPLDLSLVASRGVTYMANNHEFPFSNVILAYSKDYDLIVAFMSDNGSRYFRTHACK